MQLSHPSVCSFWSINAEQKVVETLGWVEIRVVKTARFFLNRLTVRK